jgi:hypothetical protein
MPVMFMLLQKERIFRKLQHFNLINDKARTDYANRACNVTCNVMLVAKLVPRTADEPSTQRTAILCPLMIDCTLFYRHRDECLHFITFAISLILEELIIPRTVYNNY